MQLCKGRMLGISVAIAHGVFSGSLNILLKFLISRYQFAFLTLVQCLTSSTAAISLELLRRLGLVSVPPFSLSLARPFAGVTVLSTLQSSLTLWSLRGLSLPMYVVFKRCLPLVTMLIGVLVLKNGAPSPGVLVAVLITTCGAALAGAGDLTGDPIGYVTGVLAVLVHAAYLVLIQKTSSDSEHGALTAQYTIAISATPLLIICSFASMDSINAWAFPGWKDPTMVCIFVACILIGCAMNFTTLHCTYINSAVTTSFVGVVKSIATITVGMVAFNDVEPTSLFIAGVVVNTFGSLIYCVAKFIETRKQSSYEDLEKDRTEDVQETNGAQPPFVMEALPLEKGNGEMEGEETTSEISQPCTEKPKRGVLETALASSSSQEAEGINKNSLKDAYLGVWRLVRGTKYAKKDYLLENEELSSP
ncbi:solute carrier family 35 member D3-like [Trichosurus vulpecula]|uniref:solute carrier family 35 member D3-like n=1 Tax=Trichosurus vulpecula TaxID=9337 RepID=UPI00186AC934|nr:solute carrier family 35 member D3-like [Trichosurus vulpecula]